MDNKLFTSRLVGNFMLNARHGLIIGEMLRGNVVYDCGNSCFQTINT